MPIRFKAGSSKGILYCSVGGDLLYVVIPEALRADVEVVGDGYDECASVQAADLRIAPLDSDEPSNPVLYGLGVGYSLLHATPKNAPYAQPLRVIVKPRRDYGLTILRLQNPLAVMQYGPPIEPVDMPVLKASISDGPEKQAALVKRIADEGYHQHLYVSCHRIGDQLMLGEALTDGKLFAALKGKVDTVWIGSCALLKGDPWGKQFVKDIATSAECHVVAVMVGLKTQPKLGANEIMAFTESGCTVYRPDGSPMTENAFFRERGRHRFEIVKLGPTRLA
jgi:hypothetical protein